MKKLTKLNLNDVEIMNDAQMKHVLGGGGDYPDGYDPDVGNRACEGKYIGADCSYMWGGTLLVGSCVHEDISLCGMTCNPR